MVEVANLCMGCMELKGSEGACTQCSYREGTEPDSPLHLRPRTELHGQYLVGRVLGHGGFGITYLGWDLYLERKIAIKEYLPSGVAVRTGLNSEVVPFSGETRKDFEYGLERYLDEARTVARFQTHPSVVSVLNFFRANGTAYLVMEYLEGATFERYLENNHGKTTFDTILTVMVPVLEALGSVHQTGILHRDISPDNIYITRKWQVKVLDFGAARYALGQKSRNLSVILKEGFAPVEQYHSKGNQGPWTDVYACGATIYRALTGKIPPASLDRMQSDDMQSLSAMGVELTPDQEQAVLRAMAVQPEARFHSMKDFRDALTGVAAPAEPVGETGEKLHAASVSGVQRPLYSGGLPSQSGSQPAVSQPVVSGPVQSTPPSARPISRKPQRTALPKWVWAAAAGMLLAVGGITGYKQYEDHLHELEVQKKQEIERLRTEQEIQKQKALNAQIEKQDADRKKAHEALRQQLTEQERLQRELAEKEQQLQQSQKQQANRNLALQNQTQQQTQQINRNPALQNQPQTQQPQQQVNRNPIQQQQNGLNQNPQQQQQTPFQNQNAIPPDQTYNDMMRQAFQLSRANNYQAAMQLSQQAVRINPARPEAYSNIGWIALYGSGDLQTATANYREAINRGGIVWFRVNHDHSNMTFQIHCTGDLGIAKDRIEFAAHNKVDNFRIPKSALKEIQPNKFNPFRPLSGDFHIKDQEGRNFNLISATSPKPVRDMILQLANIK